ncbi:MAG: DUF748 domain-containing protein [Methylophilaceae bacterium]|nr:DUF748 domain-containing protein [Methylophilaceae bacterium]
MWKKIAKILMGLPFVITAAVFISYLLLGYFAVNPIAQRILPWLAENKLASHASVGKVSFDPLRLTATIENFRLTQPNGAPLAGFERLFANLQVSGLFSFAWRLQELQLIAPQANIEIAPDGKLNWAGLLAKINEDKTPSKALPRLLIDHIVITRGNIQYLDRNRPTPFKAALEPLNLELDGLSTLPKDHGDYLIAAKLPEQGGTLKWKGSLQLNPLASSGTIALEGAKLERLMRIIKQAELPFNPSAGEIKAQTTYDFSLVKDQPQVVLNNTTLGLSNLSGTLAESGTLRLAQLNLQLPKLNFFMQPKIQVQFSALNLGLRALSLNAANQPLLVLPQANLNGVDFDLLTRKASVAQVTLAGGALHAERDGNGLVDWQQLLAPQPAVEAATAPKISTQRAEKPFLLNVADVQLQHWQADWHDHSLRYPLHLNVADFNLGFALSNAEGNLAIKTLNSEIGPFTIQSDFAKPAAATLAKLRVENGEINVTQKSVNLQAMVLSGLRTQIIKEANKPLNWQTMLEPIKTAQKTSSNVATKSEWNLTLKRLALEDAGMHIEDRATGSGTKSSVIMDIEKAMLEINDASLDLARAVPLKANFQVKQGGRFNANGKLTLSPLKGDLNLKLSELALKPFSPYINRLALLTLNDGAASAYGKLTLRQKKDLALAFNGGFSINKLAINEEVGNVPFLSWEQLASDNLEVGLAPNRLHMTELRVIKPTGKLIIHKDKTLNVTRLLRSPPEQPTTTAATPPNTNESATFPIIAIEHFRIDNAELEFADLSLQPQFGTHINSLSGVINGLSSNAASTAQVELDGKVDDYGSARIRGSLQPFKATDFTDLTLSFKNIEMNRITPYSGKFAGRRIDAGKLSVDLEYKIKNRQLAGNNKFVINKLKLGEKVDSPDAANLPLDLAIALLEDSDGIIDLDLPVAGSLDDPKFSYGSLVWKAITNVLGKMVTAPFRALGKLFGISSDKLEAIAFDAGGNSLTPPEQEKLLAVSQIMSKRPALTLSIEPVYDSNADTRAMQESTIRRDVALSIGIKLAADQQAGPIDLANEKIQEAIEDLSNQRIPKAELKQIEKANETNKNNALHQALLEKLTLLIPVSELELQKLAQARAEAIQQNLLQAGIQADRISLGVLNKQTGSASVNAKLSLGAKAASHKAE